MTVYGLMLMMATQTTHSYADSNHCRPSSFRKMHSPYTYSTAMK